MSPILRFVSNFFNFPFKVKTLISDRENIQIKVKNLAYKFSGEMDASLLV